MRTSGGLRGPRCAGVEKHRAHRDNPLSECVGVSWRCPAITDERSEDCEDQTTGWPMRPNCWLCSRTPQALGQLTHVELVHLIFQGTQRNSKILCGPSHVPSALFERSKNEVPL